MLRGLVPVSHPHGNFKWAIDDTGVLSWAGSSGLKIGFGSGSLLGAGDCPGRGVE